MIGDDDPRLRAAIQPDRCGGCIGHVHLHRKRGHRPQALLLPGVVLHRNFLGDCPAQARSRPSAAWCRSRVFRRCPRVAAPAPGTSSACTPSGAARPGSDVRRNFPAAARRCAPAIRTLRRTAYPMRECRFGLRSNNCHVCSASGAREVRRCDRGDDDVGETVAGSQPCHACNVRSFSVMPIAFPPPKAKRRELRAMRRRELGINPTPASFGPESDLDKHGYGSYRCW